MAARLVVLLGRRLYLPCIWSGGLKSQAMGVRHCSNVSGSPQDESFAEMFRKSPLAKMGRPQGKSVVGKITHIVQYDQSKDLYVDFGWKFDAVFTLSWDKARNYAVNDQVKIDLTALEATGHFLGQHRRITMCEADAMLKGKLDIIEEV